MRLFKKNKNRFLLPIDLPEGKQPLKPVYIPELDLIKIDVIDKK